MTAPSRIWIDAWGGNWSQLSGGTQNVEYIRADAPELLALVSAVDHLLHNYLLDEHDEPDLCVDEGHWSAIHDAFTAIAAWEAIAPKPTTDALTPWGILPDGSGLDPATLPIHRGGKASDNA